MTDFSAAKSKMFMSTFRRVGRLAYRTAKSIGARLPFPERFKLAIRSRLLALAYPNTSAAEVARRRRLRAERLLLATNAAGLPMRPEACGLVPGKVSVILPVYNQADLIAESIDSVLAQTYTNFELIILNDGSSDAIDPALAPYLGNPKVRVYTQENQRLPKALSNAFEHADGEYWTWTSADNIMEPEMLEKLVQRLAADSSIGMIYANYYVIDDRGQILQDRNWRRHNRPQPDTGEVILPRSTDDLNLVEDNFIGACFMYRGWIGRCLGDYDPQLGVEDYDYWMRINAFFPIRHLGDDVCLYRYRVHDNTLSAQAKKQGIFDKVRWLMRYEAERAEFYASEQIFWTDEYGAAWLRNQGLSQNQIAQLPAGTLPDTGPEAVLVSISTLAQDPGRFRFVGRPLAVILDDPRADYVKLHGLQPAGVLALAADTVAAARVRLALRCAVIDLASEQALAALVAFVKNRRFVVATRTAEELSRRPPVQLLPPLRHHVLLQVDDFTQGGMENVVIDLGISLGASGFAVTLAVLGRQGEAAETARRKGIDVHVFGRKPSEQAYASFLRDRGIDLVNGHFSVFGAAVCASLGIPFVQTIHNSYVWLAPDTIADYLEADSYTTSYICVSATAARYADISLGLDAAKMQVISNGIDPSALAPVQSGRSEMLRQAWQAHSGAPVFLNVAALMPPKAQLPLVRAFAQVARTSPDARLVLLGRAMDATYHREIEHAIHELGLERHVMLAGYAQDVANYYQAADYFVLPSFWEGWSLSLGEAYANGLPCVITDVGSAYEFYGDERVEVVKPPFGDIVDLDYGNLREALSQRDSAFEDRLGAAMLRILSRRRVGTDHVFMRRADRAMAYRSYAAHFHRLLAQRPALLQ